MNNFNNFACGLEMVAIDVNVRLRALKSNRPFIGAQDLERVQRPIVDAEDFRPGARVPARRPWRGPKPIILVRRRSRLG